MASEQTCTTCMVAHRQGIRGAISDPVKRARPMAAWRASSGHFPDGYAVTNSRAKPNFLCAQFLPSLRARASYEAPAVPPTAGAFFDRSSRGCGLHIRWLQLRFPQLRFAKLQDRL